MNVSFVIPAKNEAASVNQTIESIRTAVGSRLRYEVIVVDHCSDDDTPQVACRAGAKVLSAASVQTIGGVRNLGAAHARGQHLVFVDADVTLGNGWLDEYLIAIASLSDGSFAISGSLCSIPSNASWLERNWLEKRNPRALSHIGTGHLIVNRRDFLEMGGFDESLATGEDFDLSRRLLKAGGQIVRMPSGTAVHHGNPTTLWSFFLREVWHGRGDSTLDKVRESAVAKLSIIVGILSLLLLLATISPGRSTPLLVIATIGLLTICLAASFRNYSRAGGRFVLVNAVIYYVYFVARFSSLILEWTSSGFRRKAVAVGDSSTEEFVPARPLRT